MIYFNTCPNMTSDVPLPDHTRPFQPFSFRITFQEIPVFARWCPVLVPNNWSAATPSYMMPSRDCVMTALIVAGEAINRLSIMQMTAHHIPPFFVPYIDKDVRVLAEFSRALTEANNLSVLMQSEIQAMHQEWHAKRTDVTTTLLQDDGIPVPKRKMN